MKKSLPISALRSGFTLIEMLIVITIVGVLAIGAVSSYDVARRQARLNVAADTLVSSMKEQQSLARAGKIDLPVEGQIGKSSGRFCYGLSFKKDAEVQIVKAPFIAADTSISTSKSNFCNISQAQLSELSTNDALQVHSIKKFSYATDTMAVMFVPPLAKVLTGAMLDTDALASLGPEVADLSICLTVGLSNIKDEAFIKFDAASGLVSRIRTSC